MIEKGIFLEPVPLALVIVFLASVSVRDYTAWIVLCLTGCAASTYLMVRRWMRMAALRKLLATLSEERHKINDSHSVKIDSQDQGEDALNGTEAIDAAARAVGEVEMNTASRDSQTASTPSAPLSAPVDGATRVRVLTYNLYLRPPLINSNGNDWKDERLDLFIARVLPQYDIIALQEVFALGSSRQRRLVHAARQLGFGWVVSSVAPPFLTSLKFIDAGLLILSRYPIVEAAGHIYQTGFQIDHYAAKQVIFARISIPSSNGSTHDINVFTTHTQASYYENTADINAQNDAARLSQVQELLHFVNEKVHSRPDNADNPVLVLGDLNLDARASPSDGHNKGAEYKWLEDIFLRMYRTTPAKHLEEMTSDTVARCGCAPCTVNLHNSGQIMKDHFVRDISDRSSTPPLVSSGSSPHISSCPTPESTHPSVDSSSEAEKQTSPEKMEKNTTAPSEYCVRDLILESYDGDHPPTYGDAEVDENGHVTHIQEPVLTNSADWACRLAIDFIFLITKSRASKSTLTSNSEVGKRSPLVQPITTRIQKFLVNPLQNPFFQLSDHYAVDTVLDIM